MRLPTPALNRVRATEPTYTYYYPNINPNVQEGKNRLDLANQDGEEVILLIRGFRGYSLVTTNFQRVHLRWPNMVVCMAFLLRLRHFTSSLGAYTVCRRETVSVRLYHRVPHFLKHYPVNTLFFPVPIPQLQHQKQQS